MQMRHRNSEAEIDEELTFHLELLTQARLAVGVTPELAKAQALNRFGNLAQVKAECVAITKRNDLSLRALKGLLILVFMTGFWLVVLSTDFDVKHVGQLLMVLPLLTRFLIYVRGITPLPSRTNSSPLMLSQPGEIATANLDHRLLTLRGRVRSDN